MTDRAPSLSTAGPAAQGRILELDALRGLSALAVALFHYTYLVRFMIPDARMPVMTLWWGCYGVQVFFAISGFVILGTLDRTLDRRRGLGQFVRARARRLLPEYWLAMAITATGAALLGPTRLQVDPVTWVLNLVPLQLWTGTRMLDGVYWTLNCEIVFYAGMALLWRVGATRRIETVVLGWLAVKWLFWAWPVPPRLQLLFLTEQAAYFAVGLVAYRVWTGQRRWTAQLPVLGAVAATVLLLDPIEVHWLFLGVAPLFMALATGRMRWLAHPALLWMGRVSYPFYLLHAVIGYSVIWRLETLGAGPALATACALAVTGSLAAAVALLCERWRATSATTSATPHPALA